MKLRTLLKELQSPAFTDEKTRLGDLLDMEVRFHTYQEHDLELLSVYLTADGTLAVDIGVRGIE